jgi:hypothetical protein
VGNNTGEAFHHFCGIEVVFLSKLYQETCAEGRRGGIRDEGIKR